MFTIAVRLVHGLFEATSNEAPGSPEWPPHPTRLFAGLVAVAEGADDLAALDWLESLGPPVIHASGTAVSSARGNWVVTNQVKAGAHMEFGARSASGRRTWARVAPRQPTVGFTWDAVAGDHARAIEAMCRRLPYLGRSTTPVVASFANGDGSTLGTERWEPDANGSVDVTVPGAGYRSALSVAFEEERQAWTVARSWCTYRSPLEPPSTTKAPVPATPYDDMIVFGVAGRTKPSWHSVVRYTTAFRNAVMSVLAEAGQGPGPVELHGHPAEGESLPRHRVMFVGLPFVGSEHADGHLLGFGVCVPRAMSPEDRAALYRGLVGVERIFGPGIDAVTLSRGRSGAVTLDPRRWSRQSSTWVSAHPVVLDRHVAGDREIRSLLASACRHLDLPEPVDLDWSKDGLLTGTGRMRPNQIVRRRGERARPAVHARITFAEPLAGPLVLGNMRHLGLGLMLPTTERSS